MALLAVVTGQEALSCFCYSFMTLARMPYAAVQTQDNATAFGQ